MAEVIRATLRNGLGVLVAHDPRSTLPSNFYHLLIGSGAACDPQNKRGLAHVLEHVVSRAIPGAIELFPRPLLEAFKNRRVVLPPPCTSLDATQYNLVAPIALEASAFRFLADWMSSPWLDDEYVGRCIQDVMKEKRNKASQTPFAFHYDALYETAFLQHPYRWYTVGRLDDLESMAAQDVRGFYDVHYAPSNMILCCTSTNAEQALKSIEATLGALPERTRPPSAQHAEPPQTEIRRRSVPGNGSVALLLGVKCSGAGRSDHAAMRLLNHLLLGLRSGLRGRLSPQAQAFTGCVPILRDPGLYEILLLLKQNQNLNGLEEEILRETARLSRGEWREDELAEARQSALKEWERLDQNHASPDSGLAAMGLYELFGQGHSQWRDIKRRLTLLTDQEIARTAHALFQPQNVSVAYSQQDGSSRPEA